MRVSEVLKLVSNLQKYIKIFQRKVPHIIRQIICVVVDWLLAAEDAAGGVVLLLLELSPKLLPM